MVAIRQTGAMIAAMEPELAGPDYVFCSVDEHAGDWQALPALGWFREAEGLSLIVERATAEMAGLDTAQPMRRITLTVHSALDGVGLTAAVSAALAAAAIPCNMVAAFHHDHVFVPKALAAEALAVLIALQRSARQISPENP